MDRKSQSKQLLDMVVLIEDGLSLTIGTTCWWSISLQGCEFVSSKWLVELHLRKQRSYLAITVGCHTGLLMPP